VAKGRIFAFSIDLLCRLYNGLRLPCGNTGLSHNMALDSYMMMSKLQTALLLLDKPGDLAAAVVVEFRLNGVVIAVYKYLTFIPFTGTLRRCWSEYQRIEVRLITNNVVNADGDGCMKTYDKNLH